MRIRKNLGKVISLIVAISVVALQISFLSFAAGDTYSLSKMYSSEMGEWKYQWFDGDNTYYDMILSEDGRWMGAAAKTAIINGVNWHPYTTGYTVATFTCPKSGTVKIGVEQEIKLNNPAASQDGTIYIVMSDGELIGEQIQVTPDNPKQNYESVELDVYEGQVIGFYLYMNVNNAGDSTTVAPFVEYLEYKEVAPKEVETEEVVETEDVLRTDIKPIYVSEGVEFQIQPIQILIGMAPIVLIGILILVVVLKKKKGSQEYE